MSITINHQTNTISPSSGNMVVAPFSATASGAITAGNPVVLNSNGTVSAVSTTPPGNGVAGNYNTNFAVINSLLLEIPGTNTVVIAYASTSDSNWGYAQVGTISGTTISFGARTLFNSNGQTGAFGMSMCWDSVNSRVVIAYQATGGGAAAIIVGQISGTTISFGTAVSIPSSGAYVKCVFDASSGKVVLVGVNSSGTGAYAYACTVSGTTITLGTVATVHSNLTSGPGSLAYIADIGKVAYTWPDWGNRNYIAVGTVSGTTISFAAPIVYPASLPGYGSGVYLFYDTTTAYAILYYAMTSTPNTVYGAVLDIVSDTSITFNTPTTISPVASGVGFSYDSVNGRLFNTSGGTINYYTVSGTTFNGAYTSITMTGSFVPSASPTIVYNATANKVVNAGNSFANSNKGYALVINTSALYNLTATNYIGVSAATYADAATATVLTAGSVSASQSGLTPGSAYYVQNSGTISTTPDTPSVFAGTALTATSLIVKG